MKRTITASGLFLLVAILMIAFACQDKAATERSTAPQSEGKQTAEQSGQPKSGVAAQASPGEMELVGTLVQNENGFLIITSSGGYSIAGQPITQDLDEMVGRRVKVTATLIEGAERQDGTHVIDLIELTETE